ncbi:sulfur carrier protein ThiS [Deinococcus arcticus]|uniref:Thiamine biosynthesis protein ThiS n=1 Tax=Deinococcus arcticus TaxID=2136176 RepID=A0A2T3W5E0_9DEIO|nr:sulfur carrier protein ThiS [Deinococcus arcticus]PTA67101.1 thiamine biosynthesis protein ThiS [Deinococcus arcticus]
MIVNGEARPFTPGLTLWGLLRDLGTEPARVAVAVNDDFYPGARVPDRELKEGDVIEIVRIIGGG